MTNAVTIKLLSGKLLLTTILLYFAKQLPQEQ